jgi:hypothetical protein
MPTLEPVERRETGEGRDDRQPEVDQPVGEDCEERRRERDLQPLERERQERLDDAGAAERQAAARERVARASRSTRRTSC